MTSNSTYLLGGSVDLLGTVTYGFRMKMAINLTQIVQLSFWQ